MVLIGMIMILNDFFYYFERDDDGNCYDVGDLCL